MRGRRGLVLLGPVLDQGAENGHDDPHERSRQPTQKRTLARQRSLLGVQLAAQLAENLATHSGARQSFRRISMKFRDMPINVLPSKENLQII